MLDWFNNLNTKAKIKVTVCAVLGIITISLIITVFATGGLTNPF